MGLISSELYCPELEYKKSIAFLGREQTIYGLRT